MAKEPKAAAADKQADGKKQALATTMSQIEKKYGKGAMMKLGGSAIKVEAFPSGSLALDLALGVGGIPKGRIVEVYGPEASGKTTLALQMISEVQKNGGVAVFIDAEHALDPTYASSIGVDVDELYVSQPSCGEEALDIAEMAIRSGAVNLIVVDSVAALTPRVEIEGEMSDLQVGAHARLMSKALRKMTAVAGQTNCTIVFINQIREKVGVMFGSPEVTTGGRALKFYSSLRLEVRRVESIKQNGSLVGNHVRVKVVKNKVAPPFREAQFDIIFGKGISRSGELLDMGAERDVVKKSGSYYSYKDLKLGQGREAAKAFLESRPELLDEIEAEIRRIEAEKAEKLPAPAAPEGMDPLPDGYPFDQPPAGTPLAEANMED